MKIKKLDFAHSNLGGGITLFAKNVQRGGDYASVVTLSGIFHLVDGERLTLDPYQGFTHREYVQQIKAYLRGINPNITFTDEPLPQLVPYADATLYTPQQVSAAVAARDKGQTDANTLAVMAWAIKKGYAVSMSYTQHHITEKFIGWRDAVAAA